MKGFLKHLNRLDFVRAVYDIAFAIVFTTYLLSEAVVGIDAFIHLYVESQYSSSDLLVVLWSMGVFILLFSILVSLFTNKNVLNVFVVMCFYAVLIIFYMLGMEIKENQPILPFSIFMLVMIGLLFSRYVWMKKNRIYTSAEGGV